MTTGKETLFPALPPTPLGGFAAWDAATWAVVKRIINGTRASA